MSSTDDFISSWVQNDARPLTACLLSRTLEIDLAAARTAIAKFFNAHAQEMHATYLLKGLAPSSDPARPPPLPTPSKRPRGDDREDQVAEPEPMDVDSPAPKETTLILIVSEAKREAALKRFNKLVVDEVYSLHPGANASPQGDAAQLIQAGLDGLQGKALANWEKAGCGGALGALTNPEITDQLSAGDRQKLAQRVEAVSAVPTQSNPLSKSSASNLHSATSEPTPSAPGRGKRKVVKRQKTKNAKGYTVVQDVEVWESCSESEADPPAKPAAPSAQPAGSSSAPAAGSNQGPPSRGQAKPAAKKGYTGPPQKTQQSLSSFFMRKK